MPRQRVEERRAVVAELHGKGLSLRDIARRCDVSHETARRDLAAMAVTKEVVQAARSEAMALNLSQGAWETVQSEAIEALRTASLSGSVAASRALFAIAGERVVRCDVSDHVAHAEVTALAIDIFTTIQTQVLAIPYKIGFEEVRSFLDDACRDAMDAAQEDLNRRLVAAGIDSEGVKPE